MCVCITELPCCAPKTLQAKINYGLLPRSLCLLHTQVRDSSKCGVGRRTLGWECALGIDGWTDRQRT